MKTWEQMAPRERDAWIALHLMMSRPSPNLQVNPECPHERGEVRDAVANGWWFDVQWPSRYTTDASLDYQAMQMIRNGWSANALHRFDVALQRIMTLRVHRDDVLLSYAINYEPGDYCHAAFLAMTPLPENDDATDDRATD